MSETVDQPKPDETLAWREDQFLKGGLDADSAFLAAADRNIDLERFRSLRQAGCSPTMAYEIVR